MNGEREWATDGRKAERKTAFKMEAERERERRAEWELEDGQGAGGGTGRKERDGGDIEPNALNKASVMELMTGCVPLVTRTRATSPTTDARLVLRSPSRFPRESVTTIGGRVSRSRLTHRMLIIPERDLIVVSPSPASSLRFFPVSPRDRAMHSLLIRSFNVN